MMEVELNLDPGKLTNNPNTVAYFIPPASLSNLRIPRGDEPGVNGQWRPGGYTLNGMSEAVIDSIPVNDLFTVYNPIDGYVD